MAILPAEAAGSFLQGHAGEYVEVYTPYNSHSQAYLLRLFSDDVPVEGIQGETHFFISRIGDFPISGMNGRRSTQRELNQDSPGDTSDGWTLWGFLDDAFNYKTCAISQAQGIHPNVRRTFVRTLEQLAVVKPLLSLTCFVGSET